MRIPDAFTTRPTLRGSFGMAASTHWLATGTAQSVLERGGNAIDAAVAAAFVLHVVEPHLNGPGGDLVALFAIEGRDPTVLMGQGPAPAAASVEGYRRFGLTAVPGSGALAAAIPGAVDAWLLLLRDHGSWELADVLGYAIGYAEDGYPALPRVAETIRASAGLFEAHWPSSAQLWMPLGRPPAPGEWIANPALAQTYRRLASAAVGTTRSDRIDGARTSWSAGFVASAIADFVRVPHRHADGGDYAGVLTAEDLAGFAAGYEAPVIRDFRGHSIVKAGAWSQGPALLAMLGMLDGLPDLDPSTVAGAHAILEVEKLALADREAYFGDVDVPLDRLLAADYLADRRLLISETASWEFRPGRVPGVTPFVPPLVTVTASRSVDAGEPTVATPGGSTRGDTCHLDVIDRWGTIVSATPSGGWLQSSPAVPGLGFCLGTRLQMTWLADGAPSSLTPGRRPRTTLSPTLVMRDGVAVTALGSPGGDQQDQWQLLYLLRTIVGGHSPQEAIDAPALHSTSFPDSFWPRHISPGGAVIESRASAEVIAGLRERGHAIEVAGPWTLGRLSAVGRHPDGGFFAAANPRGAQGYASGR